MRIPVVLKYNNVCIIHLCLLLMILKQVFKKLVISGPIYTELAWTGSFDTYALDRLECWVWATGFGGWMRKRILELVKVFGAGVLWWLYSILLTAVPNFTKLAWMVIVWFLSTEKAWMLNLSHCFGMMDEVKVVVG